jgi:4'-phosphopantetheinyl transferase
MNDVIWQDGPVEPTLSVGDVHLWRADLDTEALSADRMLPFLDRDERERAAKFRFEQHRDRFIAGRALVRIVLGRYLLTPPDTLRFAHNAHGKPLLAGAHSSSALRFNLSHSDRYALLAVTREVEVGVDIERISERIDYEAIAARFFSVREREALSRLPDRERIDAFFACWTRKEACLKAVGDGISGGLERFVVSIDPDEPARILASQAGVSLSILDVPFGSGCRGALAVEGPPPQVVYWKF